VRGSVCPRCGAGRSGYVRSKKQERDRASETSSRARYSTAGYRRACQVALGRTGGLCAVCGARVADLVGGSRWVFRRGAGGCHHIRPMRSGGTDSPDNLAPLCVRCHNRVDGELRRRDRENGG
jgi:5-methylcytosine-specific restriction endonuclease McrA